MRQIICEKNQAPLAPPTSPKAVCKNPLCPNQNNQLDQEEYLMECQSLHRVQPPNNQAMRKLPIHPLSTTAYMTKTSKQKETNEEKQAKKRRIRPSSAEGRGFGDELEGSGERGEGPGNCTCSNFQANGAFHLTWNSEAVGMTSHPSWGGSGVSSSHCWQYQLITTHCAFFAHTNTVATDRSWTVGLLCVMRHEKVCL